MQTELPQSIREALGPLLSGLAEIGYFPSFYQQSAAFGDFEAIFSSSRGQLSLTRDRGQFIVGGARATLEPVGLWRAFGSVAELQPLLLSWLRSFAAA